MFITDKEEEEILESLDWALPKKLVVLITGCDFNINNTFAEQLHLLMKIQYPYLNTITRSIMDIVEDYGRDFFGIDAPFIDKWIPKLYHLGRSFNKYVWGYKILRYCDDDFIDILIIPDWIYFHEKVILDNDPTTNVVTVSIDDPLIFDEKNKLMDVECDFIFGDKDDLREAVIAFSSILLEEKNANRSDE